MIATPDRRCYVVRPALVAQVTITFRIILHGIERDHHAIADNESKPDANVAQGLGCAAHQEHQRHAQHTEEHKHDGEEQLQPESQHLLMHQRRYHEHQERGDHFGALENVGIQIPIDVLVQPVVHHHVPVAIVSIVGVRRPPVLIEHAIPETQQLRRKVQPRVENHIEAAQKDYSARQHHAKDLDNHLRWPQRLLAKLAKILANVALVYGGVEEGNGHDLHKAGQRELPAYLLRAWIGVPVD